MKKINYWRLVKVEGTADKTHLNQVCRFIMTQMDDTVNTRLIRNRIERACGCRSMANELKMVDMEFWFDSINGGVKVCQQYEKYGKKFAILLGETETYTFQWEGSVNL